MQVVWTKRRQLWSTVAAGIDDGAGLLVLKRDLKRYRRGPKSTTDFWASRMCSAKKLYWGSIGAQQIR